MALNYFLGRQVSSIVCLPQQSESLLFATASGAPNSGIQIYNWNGPEGLAPSLEGRVRQDYPVTALQYLPFETSSSNRLVSTNVKGELSVTLIETDADGYKLTSNSEAKLASGPATSLDVQEDRGHVVVAGEDGTYSIWDASSGKVLVGPVQASESALNTAKWISPDSFVVASHSSEYQVWDRRTSNEVPVKVLKEQANSSGNIDRRVWSLDINPARPWLLLSSISGPSNDLSPTIAFHDLRSSIQPVLANASLHQGHIWQAQFHKAEPDYVLSASDDGRLIIWDTVTAFESTTSIKPSSIASQLQKKQNYRTLRNDGLSINCFAVDTHHNLVISASDAESVAFNLELI